MLWRDRQANSLLYLNEEYSSLLLTHDELALVRTYMRQIEWLSPGYFKSPNDLCSSSLASIRLRTAVAAVAAQENGYAVRISDGQPSSFANLLIVGKIDYRSDPKRPDRWLTRLRTAKGHGARIGVDYTDHHLATNSPAAQFYKTALALADVIVCSSEMLGEHVEKYAKCRIVIIEDPIEVKVLPPKKKDGEIPTALWFGHASNLLYLINYLRDDFKISQPMKLILMTNAYPFPKDLISQLDIPKLNALDVHVVPWSLNDLEKLAEISDFAMLPTGIFDPRKNGASSNRLLTSLALGLPVATDFLPSYLAFKDYFSNLRDKDFEVLVTKPYHQFDRVEDAQKLIKSRYMKENMAIQWLKLINEESILGQNTIAVGMKPTESNTRNKDLEIVIITYNQEYLCQRIIENIESYVSDKIGVIIHDDCSSDGTYDKLNGYFQNHPHVKVFQNQSNLGITRNTVSAHSKATAEYILTLGGDDFIIPNTIDRAIQLSSESQADICIFNCAHAKLSVIDHLIFNQLEPETGIRTFPRNNKHTQPDRFSKIEFLEQIATVPGSLWLQGLLVRRSVFDIVKFIDDTEVDEWGFFHNLACYASDNNLCFESFNFTISLLCHTDGSTGRDISLQFFRQLDAVLFHWHEKYRRKAFLNVFAKKLIQFNQAGLSVDEMVSIFKRSAIGNLR